MRKLKHAIWPFTLEVNAEDGIDSWCADQFGSRFSDWYSYLVGPDRKVYAFKKEEDIIIFKLRWNHGN